MSVHIKTFSGEAAEAYLQDLAHLRLRVFREWPYLYDGTLEYERDYVSTFSRAENNILVVAFEGDEIIGASTGLPFICETVALRQPWEDSGYDLDRIYYFSESVLLKTYRGRGLGKAFFREREAWARQLKKYDLLTFCGVVRPAHHPRRPPRYRPLYEFWRKQGFRPSDIIGHMAWKDLDEEVSSEKPLRFWIKEL